MGVGTSLVGSCLVFFYIYITSYSLTTEENFQLVYWDAFASFEFLLIEQQCQCVIWGNVMLHNNHVIAGVA